MAHAHRKTTHHTVRSPGSARGTGGLTGRSEDPGRTFDTGLHKYAQVVACLSGAAGCRLGAFVYVW